MFQFLLVVTSAQILSTFLDPNVLLTNYKNQLLFKPESKDINTKQKFEMEPNGDEFKIKVGGKFICFMDNYGIKEISFCPIYKKKGKTILSSWDWQMKSVDDGKQVGKLAVTFKGKQYCLTHALPDAYLDVLLCDDNINQKFILNTSGEKDMYSGESEQKETSKSKIKTKASESEDETTAENVKAQLEKEENTEERGDKKGLKEGQQYNKKNKEMDQRLQTESDGSGRERKDEEENEEMTGRESKKSAKTEGSEFEQNEQMEQEKIEQVEEMERKREETIARWEKEEREKKEREEYERIEAEQKRRREKANRDKAEANKNVSETSKNNNGKGSEVIKTREETKQSKSNDFKIDDVTSNGKIKPIRYSEIVVVNDPPLNEQKPHPFNLGTDGRLISDYKIAPPHKKYSEEDPVMQSVESFEPEPKGIKLKMVDFEGSENNEDLLRREYDDGLIVYKLGEDDRLRQINDNDIMINNRGFRRYKMLQPQLTANIGEDQVLVYKEGDDPAKVRYYEKERRGKKKIQTIDYDLKGRVFDERREDYSSFDDPFDDMMLGIKKEVKRQRERLRNIDTGDCYFN